MTNFSQNKLVLLCTVLLSMDSISRISTWKQIFQQNHFSLLTGVQVSSIHEKKSKKSSDTATLIPITLLLHCTAVVLLQKNYYTLTYKKRCHSIKNSLDFPSWQEPTERPSMTDIAEKLTVLSMEDPFKCVSIILSTDSTLKFIKKFFS